MDSPLCRSLYAASSCFKVWLKQNFFYKKDFDSRYNPIYPLLFCWLLQCLLLATIKYNRNKHLIELFIFIFASKSSCVSLQSHPQDTLCTSFQEKWRIQPFWLKFAQKMDIDLEFQKTNPRIRISILEILCVCVCVCVCVRANFQAKQRASTFSD